jgi:hypothetical protein
MPVFDVQTPDGRKFQVDAPDIQSASTALQQHVGPKQQAAPSMATGLGRSFAEGVPILGGLVNKAEAATEAAAAPYVEPLLDTLGVGQPGQRINAPTFGERYGKALGIQEGMDQSFAKEHPVAEPVAEATGSIASLGAAGLTGAGAKLLGLTAKTLPGMMGAGAVSGGTIGALDSAARGGDPLVGGAVGAGAGLAGPVIGAGIGKLASPWLRAGKAAIDPGGEAALQISKAFGKDTGKGLSTQEIADAQSRGQPIALMDQGGSRATQRLSRRASNVSPEAQEAFDNTIFGRFREQNSRTAEFVQGMSEFGDAHELDKALTESAKRVNRPAYAKFYSDSANGVWNEGFEQISQAPVVQDAIRKAMVSAKNEAAKMGLTPPKIPFAEDARGRYTLKTDENGNRMLPSGQFWDIVKRALDKTGTREAQDWSRILRQQVDDLHPSYAEARKGAAQFFGAKDALQAGRDAVMPGTVASRADNRVLRDALSKLTPGERKLFREGTVDQMAQTLLGKPDSQNILTSINNTPKAKERMLTILGPEKYNRLDAYLRVESMMDRFRTAMGNSTTARQLGDMAEGSVIPKMRLSLSGMVEDFLTKAGEKLGRGIDERVAAKIGQMLTSGDGSEYAKALRMISSNKSLMSAIRQPAAAIGAIGVRGTASALPDKGEVWISP